MEELHSPGFLEETDADRPPELSDVNFAYIPFTRLEARQTIIEDLVHAIDEYRKASEQPLTLRGSEYAQAVHELNRVIDRAEGMLQ